MLIQFVAIPKRLHSTAEQMHFFHTWQITAIRHTHTRMLTHAQARKHINHACTVKHNGCNPSDVLEGRSPHCLEAVEEKYTNSNFLDETIEHVIHIYFDSTLTGYTDSPSSNLPRSQHVETNQIFVQRPHRLFSSCGLLALYCLSQMYSTWCLHSTCKIILLVQFEFPFRKRKKRTIETNTVCNVSTWKHFETGAMAKVLLCPYFLPLLVWQDIKILNWWWR